MGHDVYCVGFKLMVKGNTYLKLYIFNVVWILLIKISTNNITVGF